MDKIRVNISVDKSNLEKAKKKLKLFGGKLSTLFDAYLEDFIKSFDKFPEKNQNLKKKINLLEKRITKLENKLNN